MKKKLANNELDLAPGTIREDLRIEHARLLLSGSSYLGPAAMLRRAAFVKCELQVRRSAVNILFEDCLFEDVTTRGLVTLVGCKFVRCVFRGEFGRFFITKYEEERGELRYTDADDWALDLSAATFEQLTLREVPGRLLRLNPDTQMVVHRTQLPATWRSLKLDEVFEVQMECLEEKQWEEEVLVARRGNDAQRRDVARLRSAILERGASNRSTP